MKKIMMIAAALAAIATPTLAADLTTGDCLQVNAGLAALDRYDRVIKDTSGEHVVSAQYKLGGTVRFTVAQMMATLKPIVDAFEKARTALITEVSGGKPVQPNSPELDRLNVEYAKMTARPCGVTLPKIKLSDLKLGDGDDQNPIPPSVLSALLPMIEQ